MWMHWRFLSRTRTRINIIIIYNIISDEDYVDALALSQQNAASSSLLDLAIVEVGSSLLISTVNQFQHSFLVIMMSWAWWLWDNLKVFWLGKSFAGLKKDEKSLQVYKKDDKSLQVYKKEEKSLQVYSAGLRESSLASVVHRLGSHFFQVIFDA